MKCEEIVSKLRAYQGSEKDTVKLKELTREFLSGINLRILFCHGDLARYAVRKVLAKLFATPAYPLLCLNAMLQLCRDNSLQFFEIEDAELVQRINTDTYFCPFSLDRLYVETQDGVV